MTIEFVTTGRVYRAKYPRGANGMVADRLVLRVNQKGNTMQYDSPAVANGLTYPRIQLQAFLKWADRDVTDELLPGQWMPWLEYVRPLTIPERAASPEFVEPEPLPPVVLE